MKLYIVSTSRADLGIYSSFFKNLCEENFLNEINLIISGPLLHDFSRRKYLIPERINLIKIPLSEVSTESPSGVIQYQTEIMKSFSHFFYSDINDNSLFLVLGDRFEMCALSLALVTLGKKLLHIHGGELSLGALDDKYRHVITQLADYHAVSCNKHKERILSMGAEHDRVIDIGSLSVADIKSESNILTLEELRDVTGLKFNKPVALLTLHPETCSLGKNEKYAKVLVDSLKSFTGEVLITGTNSDPDGLVILNILKSYQKNNSDRVSIKNNLGKLGYAKAMKMATFMIGNSSSGIIEAASLNLPVINIGSRQKGRETSSNVIHIPFDVYEISEAIKKVTQMKNEGIIFQNIYHKEHSIELFINFLKKIFNDGICREKKFHNIGSSVL